MLPSHRPVRLFSKQHRHPAVRCTRLEVERVFYRDSPRVGSIDEWSTATVFAVDHDTTCRDHRTYTHYVIAGFSQRTTLLPLILVFAPSYMGWKRIACLHDCLETHERGYPTSDLRLAAQPLVCEQRGVNQRPSSRPASVRSSQRQTRLALLASSLELQPLQNGGMKFSLCLVASSAI